MSRCTRGEWFSRQATRNRRSMSPRLAAVPYSRRLRLEPLDALSSGALAGAVRHLPAGPVAIVNEGLLMYLDASEKERLVTSIRGILQEPIGQRHSIPMSRSFSLRNASKSRSSRVGKAPSDFSSRKDS